MKSVRVKIWEKLQWRSDWTTESHPPIFVFGDLSGTAAYVPANVTDKEEFMRVQFHSLVGLMGGFCGVFVLKYLALL